MSLKITFEGFLDYTFNIPMVLQKPRQVVIQDDGDQLRMYSFYGSKSFKEVKVGEADCFEWTSKEGWKLKCLKGDMRSIVHFSLPDSNPDEFKYFIDQMGRTKKMLRGLFLATMVLALYVARRFFMEITQNLFREAALLTWLALATCHVWDQHRQYVMQFAFGSALFCNNAFRIVEINELKLRSNESFENIFSRATSWW